ncbi:MAG: DUF523 domain-containing protein [Candidatus Uhrbacteria bacterium]
MNDSQIDDNEKILVSACLAGGLTRYDGTAKPCQKIIELVKQGKAIPVCPELLAGLSVPRNPAEQKGDKVITKDGEDVTLEFESGAAKVLEIAQKYNCKKAILKSKSPSCGSGRVYDGTFSGKMTDGYGILADLLKRNGIEVIDENDI